MKLTDIHSKKNYSFSCIYKWINLINGKVYIGQTNNFYVRMSRYKNGHYNRHMKFAIKKYGIENFDIEILEQNIPLEKLDEREQFWIDYYESYNPDKGYNISPTAGSCRGLPAWNKGRSLSEKEKEKISIGLLKYYSTHEVWNKGIPISEEAREKDRQSNLGEKNGMWGKKHSKETKRKISESLKGRPCSEKTKEINSKKIKCIETGKIYCSISEASRELGCHCSNIWRAVAGKNKTAMGYHWEYIK